jgi:hypothetical protein
MSDTTNADQSLSDRAGPQKARTKANPLGIDDIGLPSGMQPEELAKLDEVKPDPKNIDDQS